jgi:hypothetical protein
MQEKTIGLFKFKSHLLINVNTINTKDIQYRIALGG